MSEESARFHAAAKQSGMSSDEAWERMQRLNQRTDWDVERMLPGIFDEREGVTQLQEFSDEQ